MAIKHEIIDELLSNYMNPEDRTVQTWRYCPATWVNCRC
jgi:hypothetical protein